MPALLSEGMLSPRKRGRPEGSSSHSPTPPRRQPQRVTEAQPTWAPFRAAPASAPSPESLCVSSASSPAFLSPHPTSVPVTSSPGPLPGGPLKARLTGDPVPRASCRLGPLSSVSWLVKWGDCQLAPPSWLSPSWKPGHRLWLAGWWRLSTPLLTPKPGSVQTPPCPLQAHLHLHEWSQVGDPRTQHTAPTPSALPAAPSSAGGASATRL